jgi:tetratricopeptide (TPR) repeat protein
MRRPLMVAGLAIALALIGACSKGPSVSPAEQEWADFRAAYGELETSQDKAELIEAYLREHPDSPHAGDLAPAVAYYRGEELGEPTAAYTVLGETLAASTDPEARFQIAMAMFPLAVEVGEEMDLGAAAAELAAARPLSFVEMIDVADLAVKHGQWQVGAEYAEASLAKATPEAFLGDYPDDGYTMEEATAKAERRRSMALADLGWARWNLGSHDQAIAAFEEAMQLRTVDYVGASDTNLDLFAGKMALAAGDPQRAMALLAPSAVMGGDHDAAAAYREAYIADRGSDEGLEEHLWSERQSLARPVDDFTLADYHGVAHDFDGLSDGKVTLLAFWFPT